MAAALIFACQLQILMIAKTICSLFILLGISNFLLSQKSQFGAKLAGAASTINLDQEGVSYDCAPSFQLGAYYLRQAADRTIFGLEFLLNNVHGNEHSEGVNQDNRPMETEADRTYRYLSLPVYIGYQISDKWSANLGLQYSHLFFSPK